ncbi:MAG: hypothetical protein RLZZ165_257, partial [Bacteroidota bacterium]
MLALQLPDDGEFCKDCFAMRSIRQLLGQV